MAGEATVVISADDQASGIIRGVQASAVALGAVVGTVAGGAALALAALAAETVSGIKGAIEQADKFNTMSKQFGMGVEQLAAYKLAAEQSGTSLDAVATGIKSLSGAFLSHGDVLRKVGIDTNDSDKAFKQLADMFSVMPDGMGKAGLAVKLFGQNGMALIPVLNLGSKGLMESAEKSAKYATAMALMAPKAESFNASMKDLSLSGQMLKLTIAEAILPTLDKAAAKMAEAAQKSGMLEAVWVGLKTVGDDLAVSAQKVADKLNAKYERSNWFGLGDASGVKETLASVTSQLEYWQNLKGKGMVAEWITDQQIEHFTSARNGLIALTAAKEADAKVPPPVAAVPKSAIELEYVKAELAKAKEIQDAYNKALKGAGGVGKEAQALDSLQVSLIGSTEKYSEFDKVVEKVTNGPWKNFSAIGKANVLAVAGEIDMMKRGEQVHKDAIEFYKSEETALKALAAAAVESTKQYGSLIDKLDEEVKTMGMSAEQKERYVALQKVESDNNMGLITSQDDYLARIKNINDAFDRRDSTKAYYDSQQQMWTGIESTAHQTFISIFDSGKSAFERLRDTLKNTLYELLYQMTVKKWIIEIAGEYGASGSTLAALGAVAGSGSGGGSGSSSGLGSLVSTGSGVYQLYQGYTAGGGTGLWGQVGQWAGKFGTPSSYSAPTTSEAYIDSGSMGGAASAGGGAANAGEASNIAYDTAAADSAGSGASIGAGWAGLILAGLWEVGQYNMSHQGGDKVQGDSFLTATDAGNTRSNSWVNGQDWYGGGDTARYLVNGQNGLSFISNSATASTDWPGAATTELPSINDAVSRTLGTFINTTKDFISGLGGSIKGESFGLGFNQDPSGHAPDQVSAAVTDYLGNIIYSSTRDVSRGDAGKEMGFEMDRMMLAAIKGSNLDQIYKDIIPTDLASKTDAEAQALLTVVKNVGQIVPTFDRLFNGQGGLSASLAKMFTTLDASKTDADKFTNGLDNLKTSMSSYYDSFFSASEKHDAIVKDMTTQFTNMNLVLPDSRDGFRHLVESMDLTTEAGQKMFAFLMGIAPEFATAFSAVATTVTDIATAASKAASDAYMAELERERSIEAAAEKAAADAKTAWENVGSAINTWLHSLDQGALSPLTGKQKLDATQTDYVEQLMKAYNGDVTAAGSITSYADAYLTAEKAMYGFGADYSAVYASVKNQIASLGDGAISRGEKPLTSADIDALRQEVTDLKTVLARLLEAGNATTETQLSQVITSINTGDDKLATALRTTGALTAKS